MWVALQLGGGVLTTVVVVFALWSLLSRRGKQMRALASFSATPITHLVEGKPAKIVGRVALGPGDPMLAPVSQQPMVAYQGYLSFWSPGLGSRHMPFRSSTTFVLETEEGPIVVRANDAAFDLPVGDTLQVAWTDAAQWMDDMVARDGLHVDQSSPKSERTGHYRMAEGTLAPGTTIAVVGVAKRQADGALAFCPGPSLGMGLSTDPDLARPAVGRA